MMPAMRSGLLVAAVHVALVASLGAKLVIDRSTYPRVWARTSPVDPDLPIRGRYVSLRLEVVPGPGLSLPPERPRTGPNGTTWTQPAEPRPITLEVRDGQLVALPAATPGEFGVVPLFARARRDPANAQTAAELVTPVAFFIPDRLDDPSRRPPGEELWVEVTVPRRGAPRPIRLGVWKAGTLTPLDMR